MSMAKIFRAEATKMTDLSLAVVMMMTEVFTVVAVVIAQRRAGAIGPHFTLYSGGDGPHCTARGGDHSVPWG